jgi:hypothetical protein
MVQRNTYIHPAGLEQFKIDAAGKSLHILFYSASIEPEANVLCIEVTMEAFDTFYKSQRVTSFIAEIEHVVTIESIETLPMLD